MNVNNKSAYEPGLKRPKHAGVLLASAVACALGAPSVVAQETSRTAGASESLLEEVIVTARQRQESLLEAPVAVTAIGAEQLTTFAARDARDLARNVPSLAIDRSSSGGGGVIVLRGIGSSPSNAGFDQAVAVSVDGVQTGRARIIDFGMLDLKQVEVMKGPQALFFGKNSPAGVISMTSASPTRDFEGYVRAGYELEADEYITEGVISGPLTDSLSARVALRYSEMDGWLKNTAGQLTSSPFAGPSNLPQAPATDRPGDENFLGRVSFAWSPEGSPFSAELKIAGMKHSDDGPSAGQEVVNCGAYSTPVVVYGGIATVAADPFGDCKLDGRYSNGGLPNGYADNWPIAEQFPYTDTKMVLGSLAVNYDGDRFGVASITGYFNSDTEYFDNYDATVYMAYDAAEKEKFKSLSQELRLLSKFDSPVNFMLGAFYQDTTLDFTNTVLIAPLPSDAATGKYHTWEKPGSTEGQTISAFGQLIWDITPHIELAGGVRYTHEEKDSWMTNAWVHPPLSGTVLAPEGKVFTDKFEDDNLSPEATLTWRPTDNFTAYVGYKTGYKSGGFGISTNLLPPTITVDSIRFKSEEIEGFEGGVKSRLADGRVVLTSNVYSYDYTDLQVTAFNAATTSFIISNAASATIRGIEAEISARPLDWLTLNGGAAYNEARYDNYLAQCWGGQTAAQGCNVQNSNGSFSWQRSGQALSRAPDFTANGGFDAKVPLGGGFTLTIAGNARYSGDYIAADNGNPFGVQSAFWLFDANLSIAPVDERWQLSLIGKNLSNEFYTAYVAEKPGAPVTAGTTVQLMGLANRSRQVMFQGTFKF
ncbi:MAG TPA: TonB-dependent receptor [Steroidobacter sp.]|uniref:TonB-dependent receptor n=1 Tax=Steroidobacter sp. TaxID=1978227 RepID=UPI002ED9AFA1